MNEKVVADYKALEESTTKALADFKKAQDITSRNYENVRFTILPLLLRYFLSTDLKFLYVVVDYRTNGK